MQPLGLFIGLAARCRRCVLAWLRLQEPTTIEVFLGRNVKIAANASPTRTYSFGYWSPQGLLLGARESYEPCRHPCPHNVDCFSKLLSGRYLFLRMAFNGSSENKIDFFKRKLVARSKVTQLPFEEP